MKKINTPKKYYQLQVVGILLFLTSCSSFLERRNQVEDRPSDSNHPIAMVPKDQYDELSRKYQDLLDLSKKEVVAAAVVAPSVNQIKPEVGASTAIDPSELVNHIDKAIPESVSLEMVDPIKAAATKEGVKGPPLPTSMGVSEVNNTDDIDHQIGRLREAIELVKVNKFENALSILKELENSKEKQVVVRTKMILGDLLFNQGEFDLASQVYEEIIKKYSFSGYVLKALGKLVVCSEKLKQTEKQAKYYSLLHDFFEVS